MTDEEEGKVYGILCWTPTGAYWLRGKDRQGRTQVVTFSSRKAAEYASSIHNFEDAGVGSVEVMEYHAHE